MRMRVAPSVRERETPLRSPLGLPALDLLIKPFDHTNRRAFLIQPYSISHIGCLVNYLPQLPVSLETDRCGGFLISYLTHTVTLVGISLD